MDIIQSRKLDWTELGAGSVPCRTCRAFLRQLRENGHTLALHEDFAHTVHLEIRPQVRPAMKHALEQHKDHLIATLIMISIPQTLSVERGRLALNGSWQWEVIQEHTTTYATADSEWDTLLRQIGHWGDGHTAYRAVWAAAGETRRSANFPPVSQKSHA